MYYYNEKSSKKIIHLPNCHYVNGKKVKEFNTLGKAHANGYRFCRCCNPLAKQYKKEQKNIIDFCQRYGISTFLKENYIGIKSIKGSWGLSISSDGEHFDLYHKNKFETKNDYKSPVPGYHLQFVRCSSIIEYLEYIANHDYYRTINPLYIYPKAPTSPKRGTKRYKKEMKKIKALQKRESVKNVLNLIDSLNKQPQPSL